MGSQKQSMHIGGKAAQTNYYAHEQARRIGFPLTHVVTINFALTRIDPKQAVASFAKLRRHHFNKWARRPGARQGPAFPPTYLFVFENARDGVAYFSLEPGDAHNVHVHWQVHIPAQRLADFKDQIWRWVEMTTGGITGGAETIHIAPLDRPTGYLLKGALPAWLGLYGRGQKHEPQGLIVGHRRAETSRNLGPTARRAADQERGIRRRIPAVRPRPGAL